jgi:hypothetical protein
MLTELPRASAFTLQSWKTVKKPKEFLTTKTQKEGRIHQASLPLSLVRLGG